MMHLKTTVLMIMLFSPGIVLGRTVSGRFLYRDSGAPVKNVTLRLNYVKRNPAFFVFLLYPRPDTFDGSVITDNQGRFIINTRSKNRLIIHVAATNKRDIYATELIDTMSVYSQNGKSEPNVIVASDVP